MSATKVWSARVALVVVLWAILAPLYALVDTQSPLWQTLFLAPLVTVVGTPLVCYATVRLTFAAMGERW